MSRAEPGSGFLEALFALFNAKVPFESASKILRNAEIEDPDARPRTPEVFWSDHLEKGTGGTCFARVAAFDALLFSNAIDDAFLHYRVGVAMARLRDDHPEHPVDGARVRVREYPRRRGAPTGARVPYGSDWRRSSPSPSRWRPRAAAGTAGRDR